MFLDWLLVAAAGLAVVRAALGWRQRGTSPMPILLGALIALGALVAIVQMQPHLPPGGLRVAAGLVFLEMGVHAALDGLRRPTRESRGVPDPGVLLEVGESAAAAILLVMVTQRPVWIGLAVAAGVLTGGFARRRPGLTHDRWPALGVAMWFLGSSALLFFGRSR